MRRGEIRWYRFKSPDKHRPVLIMTRSSAIDYLAETTVAPITATVRGIPSEVPLTRADGPPRDCAVNLDHLQTVPKAKLGALVTVLSPALMREVSTALRFALELS